MTVPSLINVYLCAVMLQEMAALSLIVASFPHWIALTMSSKSTLVRLASVHRRVAHFLALMLFLQAYSAPDLRGTTLDARDPRVARVYRIASRLFFSGFTLLLAYLGTRVEASKYCALYFDKKRMLDAINVSETEKHDVSTKAIERELADADRQVKMAQLIQAVGQDDGKGVLSLVPQVVGSAASKVAEEDEEVSEYEFGQDAEMALVD